ncbi:MAG: hypothetical protein EAX86_10950 [Candidatus Heimdallarchaeota archaeon]|nr:hypothetical protein [Candidatus Heimdallarchaeota archaeon]
MISGYHPSTPSIPVATIKNSNLTFFQTSISGFPKLIFVNPTHFSHSERNKPWMDLIIHELRTASHTIELGSYLISNNQNTPEMIRTVIQSCKRQKVATLIASDFIQLLTSPPEIYSTSLIQIIQDGLITPNPSQIHLNFHLPFNPSIFKQNSLNFLGNYFFLKNFLTTLLVWLESEEIFLEFNIINPVTASIGISIPEDTCLSKLKNYPLIPHYISYIAAYFNGRAWLTQNTINLLFPLDLA